MYHIPRYINIKGELVDLSSPIIMGIVNITPDSFFDRSRKQNEAEIISRVQQIINEGGHIIDIGAQSTRPNAEFLSAKDELSRLNFALPIIKREFPNVPISIDTFYSEIAKHCVEKYDVDIINDISGGEIDQNMFKTVAELKVPYILMHMQGTPQNMSNLTNYKNLIQDIFYYFSKKIHNLHLLGVNDIIIDLGFGFSKNTDQNYQLLASLNKFTTFGLPILVGISRKGMINKILDNDINERLNGTTILNTFAILNGANILRVHDVKEAKEVILLTNKLKEFGTFPEPQDQPIS